MSIIVHYYHQHPNHFWCLVGIYDIWYSLNYRPIFYSRGGHATTTTHTTTTHTNSTTNSVYRKYTLKRGMCMCIYVLLYVCVRLIVVCVKCMVCVERIRHVWVCMKLCMFVCVCEVVCTRVCARMYVYVQYLIWIILASSWKVCAWKRVRVWCWSTQQRSTRQTVGPHMYFASGRFVLLVILLCSYNYYFLYYL